MGRREDLHGEWHSRSAIRRLFAFVSEVSLTWHCAKSLALDDLKNANFLQRSHPNRRHAAVLDVLRRPRPRGHSATVGGCVSRAGCDSESAGWQIGRQTLGKTQKKLKHVFASTEMVETVVAVARHSRSLKRLVLSSCGLTREFPSLLAAALAENDESVLETIDISRNPTIDDRKGEREGYGSCRAIERWMMGTVERKRVR